MTMTYDQEIRGEADRILKKISRHLGQEIDPEDHRQIIELLITYIYSCNGPELVSELVGFYADLAILRYVNFVSDQELEALSNVTIEIFLGTNGQYLPTTWLL